MPFANNDAITGGGKAKSTLLYKETQNTVGYSVLQVSTHSRLSQKWYTTLLLPVLIQPSRKHKSSKNGL